MALNPELPGQRMRLLFTQMKAEGLSQAEISRQTQYGETALSRFLEEGSTRSFDMETLTRVIQSMRLDANYFFAADLGKAPYYRDHLRRKRSRPPPYWDDFLMHYGRINELGPEDLERLTSLTTEEHQISSWQSWASLASWYLDHRHKTRK